MPALRIRLIFLDNFFGNKKASVTKLEVHRWAVDQNLVYDSDVKVGMLP